MEKIEGGLSAVQDVWTSGVHAGFKTKQKDLALIYFPKGATVAGVFTRNLIKGHPVLYGQEMLKKQSEFKAVIINSGNANVSNGLQGDQDVLAMAEKTAKRLDIRPEEVLVSSTGIIGVPMDLTPLESGLEKAVEALNDTDSTAAAKAIMTTDTKLKQVAYRLEVEGETIHIGGIIKGAGMIHPNMGTMLGYLTTDLALPQKQLQEILRQATDESFNLMTVDGDTSTNDTVLLASTNAVTVELTDEVLSTFSQAITEVCQELAKKIAADGEGQTKFVEVNVQGAASVGDAKKIAKTVATSSLVKTALYGGDANWGRVLMAIGNSEPSALDPYRLSISFASKAGELLVCQNGQGVSFSEAKATEILSASEIQIEIDVGLGEGERSVWTCDMSLDYIKINSDYRS